MPYKVAPPLKLLDRGRDVVNLQDALRILVDRGKLTIADRAEQDILLRALERERTREVFGDNGTLRLVQRFQTQYQLNTTGEVDAPTAEAINRVLTELGEIAEPDTDLFVVEGFVLDADGKPLRGVAVHAFDQDLRSVQRLGQPAVTDKAGYYRIVYREEHFAAGDFGFDTSSTVAVRGQVKTNADLWVGVPADTEGFRIRSDIRYNAQLLERIDLRMPDVQPTRSEFELLLALIVPRLGPVQLHDLEQEDIEFLARDSSDQRERITALVTAARLSEEARTLPLEQPEPTEAVTRAMFQAALYGLVRREAGRSLRDVLLIPGDTFQGHVREATRANLIPAFTEAQARSLDVLLTALRAELALRPAAANEPATLGDVLATLPAGETLSNDQRSAFARLRDELGETDQVWGHAEAAGLSPAIPALKRTIALAELTNGHPSLMRALHARRGDDRPDSVEYLADLSPRQWIQLAFEHGAPPGRELALDAYVEGLQRGVEQKFPTRAVRAHLEREPLETEEFSSARVVEFLRAHPSFDLRTQPVEPFLAEQGTDDPALRDGLLKVQRLQATGASPRELGLLLNAGFGAASQMVGAGERAVIAALAPQVSEERARELFAGASAIRDTVMAFAGNFTTQFVGANSVAVVPSPGATEDTLRNYPSLRRLFGDLDYCECRHCQSVIGPAAYLTDLMHFLQRSPLTPNTDGSLWPPNLERPTLHLEIAARSTVLGALLQRRPDLADLELSCENTNTEIPYIDLVLEILENAVGLPLAQDTDAPEFAGIDIDVEFTRPQPNVPEAVVKLLRRTADRVGNDLTVTHYPRPGLAPSFFNEWIIKDGSRRWWIVNQNRRAFLARAGKTLLPLTDTSGTVDALERGILGPELETILSRELPIEGAPQIQENGLPGGAFRRWTVLYSRAISVKITLDAGVVELFKLDGTSIRVYPDRTVAIAATTLAPGTTKIDPYVAQLLELPPELTYSITWNATRSWWELRAREGAYVFLTLPRLIVAGLTYQNSSIREHLASTPENRNPSAYDKLATDAVYPWTLPFDLWTEETRAVLDGLGTPRLRLVDIARPQTRLNEEAAILELLGLSQAEAQLITTTAAASKTPWVFWGFAKPDDTIPDETAGSRWPEAWPKVLEHLSLLLQQSRLSHREYLDFLQTRFAGEPVPNLLPPNECKTSKLTLDGLDETALKAHLHRLHVFTRLWRRLGWSMRELDLALVALGAHIDAATLQGLNLRTLQGLALLKRLKAVTGLPLGTLIGCVDRLETRAWTDHTKNGSPVQQSLYSAIFHRESLRSMSGFDDFALNATGSELVIAIPLPRPRPFPTTAKISDRADFIGAALGVKPATVRRWVDSASGLGIADVLNLDTLSRLHAAASVCRALSIAPDSLPAVVALLGSAANPFVAQPVLRVPVSPTPVERARQTNDRARALLEFIERVDFIRKSGVEFETLSYLLQHAMLPGTGSDASNRVEQQIVLTLTELKSDLQSGAVLGDRTSENLNRQLARRGWYPALIDALTGSDGLNYQLATFHETALREPEPVIPLHLRSKFAYHTADRGTAVLECFGSLTDEDFTAIGELFPPRSVAALKNRYKDMLGDRTRSLASLLQILELDVLPTTETQVTGLTALPIVPAEFKDRLEFTLDRTSPTQGTLKLKGWLSDAERQSISHAERSLAAALSTLQTRALENIPALSPATIADAERILREPDIERRQLIVLLRLVPLLEMDVLAGRLSTALVLDERVVAKLLDRAEVNGRTAKRLLTDPIFLSADPKARLDRSVWPAQFSVVELLTKIASVGESLGIAPDQWQWVLGGPFDAAEVTALPTSAADAPVSFDAWRRLVELFHLRDVVPQGPDRLTRIDEALRGSNFAKVQRELAEAFELDATEAVTAASGDLLAFEPADPKRDYHNPSRLLELTQLLHVIKALGATASAVRSLIQAAPDETVAQLARKLFAASVDAKLLPERLRPISNRLRDRQRDALVAYLVHRDRLIDSNELFDRYLIDVEMGSCMLTSRVKQAISSVQLFVQRCLLNLEQARTTHETGVSPGSIDTRRWEWMKYYRVWEANRKVFLYPENWIEPELRDDKSEIFSAFESDLLQGELTHTRSLDAFRKYADQLGEIARLTIVGMFADDKGDRPGQDRVIHVVGRTNSQPYEHYYRRWRLRAADDYGTWSAWEEIPTQIDSDHVVLFVHAGSVHIAWPSFSANDSKLLWTLRMNLVRRTASGWTKQNKGRGELGAPMVPNKDERVSFAFRIRSTPAPNEMVIDCYSADASALALPPRDEVFEASSSFPALHRVLHLSTRTLAKYIDASGRLFYLPVSAQIQATVIFSAMGAPEPKTDTISVPMSGSAGGLDGPLVTRLPDSRGFIGFYSLMLKAVAPSNYYKPSPPAHLATSSKPLDRDAAWTIDFVFDIDNSRVNADDPLLGVDRSLRFMARGSFRLADDGAFELGDVSTSLLDHPSPGAEHFDSGSRERANGQGLYLGDSRILSETSTPGRFFTARSARDLSTYADDVVAYRDDIQNLLLWRTPEQSYRVVPTAIMETLQLRRSLASEQLEEALSLMPVPARTGSIPTAQPDGYTLQRTAPNPIPATNVDPKSKLRAPIGFEGLPSANYYWEVFFHIPLLVATQLSNAQRFEEAQRWFHLIFDPTTNEAARESSRYWRFRPFRDVGPGLSIDDLLTQLASGKPGISDQITNWAESPFRPHLIARQRYRAYQLATVFKYIENLIAWGDQHFRRDTIESINEATQLYVLAARILGNRPTSSPRSDRRARSYRDIQSRLDDFSNAWIPLEGMAAAQGGLSRTKAYVQKQFNEPSGELLDSLGSLYFCIPRNEKLDEYWDTVENRLFNIRHCRNIEGIERKLPLFEPPIDPALLVRATAAGLDLGTVLADLQAPLPTYRFNVVLQKALEICAEVKALGSSLLGALEKRDAEEVALLRSSHERALLDLVKSVKRKQVDEADANLVSLRQSRDTAAFRYAYYQGLMGKQGVQIPQEGSLAAIEPSNLQAVAAPIDSPEAAGLALIPAEAAHLQLLALGQLASQIASGYSVLAGVFHAIPDFTSGATIPAAAQTEFGGSHLGAAVSAAGAAIGMAASQANFTATVSAIIGGHQRRFDEWKLQSNLVAKELAQIDKQIAATTIRKEIAEGDLATHERQIDNARDVDEIMHDKFTNKALYSWMAGQVERVYFRTYQLAHDMAKRAERAYRFELGSDASRTSSSAVEDSSFIGFQHWDSLRKGLWAGERLHFDLKRLEVAYLEQNKREYEITRHVSLLSLDPLALINLRQTGRCEFKIPETLYDLDCPGHFMRRIKSVGLTIPCVTGPYTGVHCTLTLLSSSIRKVASLNNGAYERALEHDDSRFVDDFSSIQSIVTSSAQGDSGLFETNLRDERYLPFEGAGAVNSAWRLELPADIRQFDYDTISDVILHVRYTARPGAMQFKERAAAYVTSLIKTAEAAGMVRLFSVRHEFPSAWAKFTSVKFTESVKTAGLSLDLRPEHYPFWSQGRLHLHGVKKVDVIAKAGQNVTQVKIASNAEGTQPPEPQDILKRSPEGLLKGELAALKPPSPVTPKNSPLRLFFTDNTMEDLWLAVNWQGN